MPIVFGRSRHRPHRAFSVMELMVVLGILVILCGIFIPYVGKVREINRRVACANNLRTIYAALAQYSDMFGRDLPRVVADPARPGRFVAFTGADWVTPPVPARPPAVAATQSAAAVPLAPPPAAAPAGVPVAAAAPAAPAPATSPTEAAPPRIASPPASQPASPASQPVLPPSVIVALPPQAVQLNDVTASLWLLVKMGFINAETGAQVFVCPSSSQSPDPMLTGGKPVRASERSNFTSPEHLSYSYSSPFSAASRFRLNSDTLPPDFAILADRNPGVAGGSGLMSVPFDAPPLDFKRSNSRNHDRAGQNVLYVTGSVQFQKTPYCGYGTGWARDNIYTATAESPLPPAGTNSPQATGVYSRDVGPAWAYDSYLVPADQ